MNTTTQRLLARGTHKSRQLPRRKAIFSIFVRILDNRHNEMGRRKKKTNENRLRYYVFLRERDFFTYAILCKCAHTHTV